MNYENLSHQDYGAKLIIIGVYNSQLQALFSSHNTNRVANVQSIINNLPSRNNTTSGYYADAYEQALNLIGDNPIDKQKLNSLAFMCPIEAGEAVYLARQILKALGQNNIYDDISVCDRPDSAPRSSSNENVGQIVKSYPNPTSGVIRFDTKENIVAVSVSGATNSFVKVELNDNYIDISNYLPGIYLVKIEMQSGDIIFEKIVLVK
jgi:hypothetical protein